MITGLAIALPIVLVATALLLYNGLVRARLRVREAWSLVDVQLQRRAALIPNLVEAVKGYAAYERGTMMRIAEARGALGASPGPRAAAQANDTLTGALQTFFAVAEAYPDLKASQRFAQLQTDLADTENKIAYARSYYNAAVQIYNTKVQSFPGLTVASPFGFSPAEFFTASAP
jgi:LemA protein